MKIAYFDCFSGISGDMTLGALIDAGIDESQFRSELAKLPDIEFDLKVSKTSKGGITATDVEVIISEEHHHRHLHTIEDIITRSSLDADIKAKSIRIFRRLAEAEAKVHGTSPEEVHFHEVGAVDAIVDIVGSVIGLHMLGIEKVFSSPLPMGYGFVNAAHGKIPVPAPATVELLRGVPVYSVDIEGELVTPTGAAIISTLSEGFGKMPSMKLIHTAYGAGKKDFETPNVLRIFIGDIETHDSCHPPVEVSVIETNIDDMNPEFYDIVIEKLLSEGALDVYLSPIQMKKNRPSVLLCAICPCNKVEDISKIILTDTTSFGVRISYASRLCLDRRWETISTEYGDIRIKIGILDGCDIKASPEYEDCKSAARAHNVSIQKIYQDTISKYHQGR